MSRDAIFYNSSELSLRKEGDRSHILLLMSYVFIITQYIIVFKGHLAEWLNRWKAEGFTEVNKDLPNFWALPLCLQTSLHLCIKKAVPPFTLTASQLLMLTNVTEVYPLRNF